MKHMLRAAATAATVIASSLSTTPARAYPIDCAILLCLAGGWPASVPCTKARAEFIRRITPWPVEPPLQIWRCPMGASYHAPAQPSPMQELFAIGLRDLPSVRSSSSPVSVTPVQSDEQADIDISGDAFDFVRRIRVYDTVSGGGDTSLSIEESNKTIFSGQINIIGVASVFQTRWAELIKAAKAALPCWNVDTQVIWERFVAFNRARGNEKVPAGFLLGFMRRWRTKPDAALRQAPTPAPQRAPAPTQRELHDQIKAAPVANRQFHASDLCRAIGQAAYDARVLDVTRHFGCPRFTATLAVHGRAVMAGEIPR